MRFEAQFPRCAGEPARFRPPFAARGRPDPHHGPAAGARARRRARRRPPAGIRGRRRRSGRRRRGAHCHGHPGLLCGQGFAVVRRPRRAGARTRRAGPARPGDARGHPRLSGAGGGRDQRACGRRRDVDRRDVRLRGRGARRLDPDARDLGRLARRVQPPCESRGSPPCPLPVSERPPLQCRGAPGDGGPRRRRRARGAARRQPPGSPPSSPRRAASRCGWRNRRWSAPTACRCSRPTGSSRTTRSGCAPSGSLPVAHRLRDAISDDGPRHGDGHRLLADRSRHRAREAARGPRGREPPPGSVPDRVVRRDQDVRAGDRRRQPALLRRALR